MKNKKTLIIIILVFIILMTGATVLYRQLGDETKAQQLSTAYTEAEDDGAVDEDNEEEQEFLAPDFVVYDEAGNAVNLSDFFGKPIILNFWASWCGPCKSEMPDFNEKYLELGQEFNFVMINMTDGSRETVETASAFITEQGYEFPVFYDTQSEAAYTYGAYSLPTTYFIDAEGHVIAQATGAIDGETLQRGIDMIK